jgi:hypothetical protein
MGPFAVNLAISYQVGSARALLSILSAMGISSDEFFSHIGQSINGLILKHRFDLDRQRLITGAQRILKDKGFYSGEVTGELNPVMTAAVQQYLGPDRFRDAHGADILGSLRTILDSESKTCWIDLLNSKSKTRWVDGTPEYSWHICGLRKLFPDALFIHIVRDALSVVRSILNFHRIAGTQLVASEEEAYRYWLRTVSACLTAERAYGTRVIHRLKYSDLIGNPEAALRSLLNFLGEPYSEKCLEPLSERINSSDVPADFRSDDPATAPVVVEQAMRLSRDLEQGFQPAEASPAAVAEMQAAFAERVQHVGTLESQHQRALQIIQTLERTKASENAPFCETR